MLTAGPNGSVGGAFKSPCDTCARVSFTVLGESVIVLLKAIVWSMLSSPAEALGAFGPPAPRELTDVTLYRLYRMPIWSRPLNWWSILPSACVACTGFG